MAISLRLQLRQSQALVMTPQLMQAIKLLQLSNLDLVAFVDAELERNPLLERDEGEPAGDVGAAENEGSDLRDAGDGSGDPAEASDFMAGAGEERAVASMDSVLDSDMANVYPDDRPTPERTTAEAPMGGGDSWAGVGAGRDLSEDYNPEAFVASETSLKDHLTFQLGLAEPDPARRLIGLDLIGEIDEAGYLRADLATVAARLDADPADVASVLRLIQTFEPAGVAARDLAECLSLQLKERGRLDPAMAVLVGNLDLLARRDFVQLKRLCRVNDEDLSDMVEEIRSLSPKPGHAFGGGVVHPVVPDVIVRARPDGGWAVELNADTLPKVLVNQTYYASVAKAAKKGTEKSFLTDCLASANWLVKSLDQRARTILKVAAEIVVQQDGFLSHGIRHLRPLNLKTVAEAIGMHESTVSRVTSNKYVSTPRGIFELKYFFTSAIAHADGGAEHSAESVRHRIREMIEDETPSDVLSDDTIVGRLREAGVDIARRTVAKYREGMRIPSSVQRRREKQALV